MDMTGIRLTKAGKGPKQGVGSGLRAAVRAVGRAQCWGGAEGSARGRD